MTENEISRYRAEVIEKTIIIESLMCGAITINYFGHIKEDFLLEVMFDESFNAGLKLKILKKTFPDIIDNRTEEKIRRLLNIRNVFAHNHNVKIYNGKEWVVINPKNYSSGNKKAKELGKNIKGIDFRELYKEFNYLMTEIEPLLGRLVQ